MHRSELSHILIQAYIMSRYISSHLAPLQPETRCIELGSGSGLVGMTAWLAGADVVLTELPGKFVEHLETNVSRNVAKLSGSHGNSNGGGVVEGSSPEILREGNIQVHPLDWNNPPTPPSPPYDLILGSEILYLPHLHRSLVRTLNALCHPPDSARMTTVLMVYKERGLGEEAFFEWAKRLGGFEVEWVGIIFPEFARLREFDVGNARIPQEHIDPEFQSQPYCMFMMRKGRKS
ncbi:hypothetical protein BC936DRAFT_148008 [Jimgerdemannia flammicorona]|uniref:Methyltransferase-domain-containing protein n=1 Tax=Jimgerdemannia flammicorona TaxID=994334 RepID=A0A433D455_9FUNG|nr:hypothetical protein BC936DRAFT_148008 [Jimgerdemannia flammicorona]